MSAAHRLFSAIITLLFVAACAPSATTPTVAPTTEAPTPTPEPTRTTSRAPVVVPVPTQKPPEAELPPPPPPEIPDTPDCVQHPGPDAAPADVAAALTHAGAVQYWKGVVPPKGLTPPLPVITVPANVMKAVAWAGRAPGSRRSSRATTASG